MSEIDADQTLDLNDISGIANELATTTRVLEHYAMTFDAEAAAKVTPEHLTLLRNLETACANLRKLVLVLQSKGGDK